MTAQDLKLNMLSPRAEVLAALAFEGKEANEFFFF